MRLCPLRVPSFFSCLKAEKCVLNLVVFGHTAVIRDSGNVIYVDLTVQIVAAAAFSFRPTARDCLGFIETILLPMLKRLPR